VFSLGNDTRLSLFFFKSTFSCSSTVAMFSTFGISLHHIWPVSLLVYPQHHQQCDYYYYYYYSVAIRHSIVSSIVHTKSVLKTVAMRDRRIRNQLNGRGSEMESCVLHVWVARAKMEQISAVDWFPRSEFISTHVDWESRDVEDRWSWGPSVICALMIPSPSRC